MFRTTKICVIILSFIVLVLAQTSGLATTGDTNLYHRIGGGHYHTDPVCSLVYRVHYVTMESFDRSMLDQEPYLRLRPCMICAAEEYAAFYEKAKETLPPEEIARMEQDDQYEVRLIDRDNFTFEDWAELQPGRHLVPSETDITVEEAIRAAGEAIAFETGFLIEDVRDLRVEVYCVIGYNMEIPDRDYTVTFITGDYGYLYSVQLSATTARIWRIDNFGDRSSPFGILVYNVGCDPDTLNDDK